MAKSKAPEKRSSPTRGKVDYPSSDGKPIAETDMHIHLLIETHFTLQHYFRNRQDVYVSADLLLYYEEGNPKKSVVPNVFVVFGVEKKKREHYLLWEEGKGPDFVLEISHPTTYDYDLGEKKRLYAEVLGVSEYFIYDPEHYLRPPLQGYRLVDGIYYPIPLVNERFQTGYLLSEVLGLEIGLKTRELDFYDPRTWEHLLMGEEWNQRFRESELRTQLEKEIHARQLAEARAEQALAIAEQALARAHQAEAELARLRAPLEQLPTQQTNEQ